MQVNTNSWHKRLNGYFYGNGYFREIFYNAKEDKWDSRERQKNLCPYFWGTILAIGFVCIVFLGKQLAKVVNKIPSVDWEPPSMSEDMKQRIGKIVLWLLVGFAFAGVMIYGSAYSWENIAWAVIYGGALVGGLLLLIFLSFGVKDKYDDWRNDHPKKEKPKKEKKPNMLKEFLSGWYHKHCPRLEWTND